MLLIVFGTVAAHAKEKFSLLTTKEYYFLYKKSTDVKELALDTVYTVAQVEKAMHCSKYAVIDAMDGTDPGLLIIGKCGGAFKIVLLLRGENEEHSA